MRIPFAIAAVLTFLSPPSSAQIVADFEASKTLGVTPMFVQFTNLSTYPDDPNIHFFWNFGDGEFGVGKNPSHLYLAEGVYTVSLAIHYNSQEVATKTRSAYITTYDLVPDFDGGPILDTPPITVSFTNRTPDLPGIPVSYVWDFGDGATSTAVSPTHTYTDEGVFTVSMHATGDGQTRTMTETDYVVSLLPHPQFTAWPRSGYEPLNVQFTNETEDIGFPVSYRWTFGDGTSSTESNPVHRYESNGAYTVTLEATTAKGVTRALTEPDHISVGFRTGFTAMPRAGTTGLSVQFTDLSAAGPEDTRYHWEFGDGHTSDERDPLHTYHATGSFTVRFTKTVPPHSTTETKVDYIVVSPDAPAGDRHYVAFPHILWNNSIELSLSISSASAATGASGTVEFPGIDFSKNFTVAPQESRKIVVPFDAMIIGSDVVLPVGGVITADAPLQVQALAIGYTSADGFDVHPEKGLGLAYRLPAVPQVTVLAAHPATTVTISSPRTQFTLDLDYLEVYNLKLSGGGWSVNANAPVAVFAGSPCAMIAAMACDGLLSQVPPIHAWGKEHVAVPLATREIGPILQILAHEDDTTVTVDGLEPATFTLSAREYTERETSGVRRITSTKPVLVTQYAAGGDMESDPFDHFNGDPFMLHVIPTERFLKRYTVRIPAASSAQAHPDYKNFINIVASSADALAGQVRINGQSVSPSKFEAVPNSTWMAAQIARERGTHTITAPNPLGISVYGFAWYESYGYSGAMRFDNVAPRATHVLRLRKNFLDFDTDGDKRLSLSEAIAVGIEAAEFGAIDLDGDGYISTEELLYFSVGPPGATSPVYVDFTRMNIGRGTLLEPFNLFHEAQVFVKSGGVVRVIAGDSPETFSGPQRLSKPMRVLRESGPISIGGAP